MRFSEEELFELAKLPPDLDGVLQFKTQASRIRDQIQGSKTRWFKLKGNFLFYYRINDEGTIRELVGALLMERFRILLEVKPNYAFSIVFQNDRERKYIFVASSNPECQRWVRALKNASYEKLQTQFFLLQQKLIRITGKNPVQRHGLQRYYVDFLTEDGIEMNDDEIKIDKNELKNTKEIKTNRRHPLAAIQENRFQQEQKSNQEEKCVIEFKEQLVVGNNKTMQLCVDSGEPNESDVIGKKKEDNDMTVEHNEMLENGCGEHDETSEKVIRKQCDIEQDKTSENISREQDENGCGEHDDTSKKIIRKQDKISKNICVEQDKTSEYISREQDETSEKICEKQNKTSEKISREQNEMSEKLSNDGMGENVDAPSIDNELTEDITTTKETGNLTTIENGSKISLNLADDT